MMTSRSEQREAGVERCKRYCEQVTQLVEGDFDEMLVYKPPGALPGEAAIQVTFPNRTEIWRMVFVAGQLTGWARMPDPS